MAPYFREVAPHVDRVMTSGANSSNIKVLDVETRHDARVETRKMIKTVSFGWRMLRDS